MCRREHQKSASSNHFNATDDWGPKTQHGKRSFLFWSKIVRPMCAQQPQSFQLTAFSISGQSSGKSDLTLDW
jgi:hypothetical protein